MEKTLTIFDIDDTLFHTKAKVLVRVGDKVVRRLTSSQYNKYELKDREWFDFTEFSSAKLFAETSKPIRPIITKARRILSRKKNGSRLIFLTARPDQDDRELFLEKFRTEGIDIDSVYVERAGNYKTGTTAEKKNRIIRYWLKKGNFSKIRMFDDAEHNLTAFLSLQSEFLDTTFEAYLVNPKDGSINRYKTQT